MSPGIAVPIGATHRLPAWALGLSALAHLLALFGPAVQREKMLSDLPPLAVSFRTPAVVAAPAAASAPTPTVSHPVQPALPAVARAPAQRPALLAVAAGGAPGVAAPAASITASIVAAERSAVPPPLPAEALPAAASADAAALARYIRLLGDLLAQQQQYPRLAAARGWEGEVRLRLQVARKGTIVAIEIVHSSGFDVLDQSAVQLVHNATLPPPPAAGPADGASFQIDIPIHYTLKRST